MAATKARSRSPRSTPQERAEKQATRVAELKGQFDAAVSQLVTTDTWRTMLDGAIHLHRYSFRNMLLLLSQCPHTTQVAGYREWHKRDPPAGPGLNRREGDGRHDRKRQRGRAVVLARPTTDFLAATA